ncbi:MAG: acyltransferase [Treponemataceae bacterium]|nr:acyltransferase [Treponemataceae bacterium]
MSENINIKKEYYKSLDIIRNVSCFAVLLYHLDILKGGCLAVCSFFTLSGYLSCITNFNKKKFSFFKYYKNRFIKIYIPIVITVFATIFTMSFFKNIKPVNLKPEVASILLGYNNFWQLSVQLDYFSAHINSPFMHFWYMAILLQFELVFPFVFIALKKVADKSSEGIPVIITLSLGIISAIFFYKICFTSNITNAYYNTFSHAFSWLLGISLGFCHCYKRNLLPIKFNNETAVKIIFALYMTFLFFLFIFVDGKSEVFPLALTITTILTTSLIDYGALIANKDNSVLKFFASLSYEIYLVQYPIIFICEHMFIFEKFYPLEILAILVFTLAVAFLIHFGLTKTGKHKVLKIITLIGIFAITALGIYKFATMQDYANQMDALEKQLEENRILLEQKKAQFYENENQGRAEISQESETQIFETAESENEEFSQDENFDEKVKGLAITAFGDSIMLGAFSSLYEIFPNIYIDAKKSRSIWSIYEPLENLVAESKLGDPVVIHLGSNGDSSKSTKDAIMELIGSEREVFWLTVTNDKIVKMNSRLKDYAKKFPNLHIIDWETFSKGHDDFFAPDNLHLSKSGQNIYAKFIFDSLKNFYFEKAEAEKRKALLMKKAEEERLVKIAELQFDILKFLAKRKKSKNEIVAQFVDDNRPQDYIELRIEELQENELIAQNKKGFFVLTKSGKLKLKESATLTK